MTETKKERRAKELEKAKEYCEGCVKFREGKCLVFKELYPMWGEGECWSREESYRNWLKQVEEMNEYIQMHYGAPNLRHTQAAVGLQGWITEERNKAAREVEEEKYEGWEEVMKEDQKRGKPGGGGEKADRTNKAFGPQQQKDNRFMHRKRNPRKYRD